MKKCKLVVKLCVVWCALLGSCATAGFEMTFEEFLGNDGAEIGTFYPGVRFEAMSTGEDWIVSDVTTGDYNASSWPSGQSWNEGWYWIYDFVSAWTGVVGDGGKISFDQYVTYVEIGYCCNSQLSVTAYDAQDNPIDSATGPANRRYTNNNESGPGLIRVETPSGNYIKYIIIHDTGNYWVVDNIFVGTDIILTKEDDVNDDPNYPICVTPGTDVTYTICYENVSDTALEDVYILDRLPAGVDYDYILSENPLVVDPNYDIAEHTYRWDLGTVASEANGCVQLTVTINQLSEPTGAVHNSAEIWSGDTYLATSSEDTPICCWGGDIIYVDPYATGHQTGVDWDNAYTDLQTALTRAAHSCGSEIWVARGTYSPGSDVDDSFVVSAGVELYGGFAGTETARSQRDHTRYQTILTGYINETTRNEVVVTMGNNSILDGFVVEKSDLRGIEGISTSFEVSNCTVVNNSYEGIRCENGNLIVQWCDIKGNGRQGIYHEGSGYTLSVENCKISGNQWDGITIVSSSPQIKNSFICKNGSYGIEIGEPSSGPVIHNNTIAHNNNEGIYFEGSNTPDVRNCIIWQNNTWHPDPNDWHQLSGYGTTYYSCVTDPNDPNGLAGGAATPDGNYNISANPRFAYSDPNYPHNYHLTADSPCIDKGDDSVVTDETDIDNGERIVDWLSSTTNDVDMGADELSCEDVENVADLNSNGVVNLAEFAMFSAAWLSEDPNDTGLPDPNWNGRCDINDSGIIDLADLVAVADNWLWSACWRPSSEGIWMMMAGGGGDSSSAMTAATSSTVTEAQPKPTEMTLEERIAQLTDILNWLEDEISQNEVVYETITKEQIQAFIDDVLKMIEDLKTDYDSD